MAQGVKPTMVEIAKRKREPVLRKIDKLEKKLMPLRQELLNIDRLIHYIETGKMLGCKSFSAEDKTPEFVDTPKSAALVYEESFSITDIIRAALNKRMEISSFELDEFCSAAFPSRLEQLKRQKAKALQYLTVSSELEKIGAGHQAIYRKTSTMKNPLKNENTTNT